MTHKEINLHLYESVDLESFYQQEKKIRSRTFPLSFKIHGLNYQSFICYIKNFVFSEF